MAHHNAAFDLSRGLKQQQQPAGSCKAVHSSMATGYTVVGRYLTSDGKVGMEIRINSAGLFAYAGTWGAGSALDARSVRSSLRWMLQRHRGVVADIPFGGVELVA